MESSSLLGHSAAWWDAAMLWSLFGAAIVAAIVAGATACSVIANKREAAASAAALDRYKIAAGVKISVADARAAAAELETERLKSLVIWRSISEVAAKGLAARLAAHKARITLGMISNDPEAFSLTAQLQPIFEKAGWESVPMSGWWGKWLPVGVHIYGSDKVTLKFLEDAFAAEHIQFSTDAPPGAPDIGLVVPGPPPEVTVLVGSRIGPFK